MNFRRNFVSSSVVCIVLGLLVLAYSRPVAMLCLVRWHARSEPEWWVVPKPISDLTIAAAKGKKYSYFGYEFDTPWTELDQERKLQSIAILNFSSGAFVSILDPAGGVDELSVLKAEAAKSGTDIKTVFGEEVTHSNYALRSKILNLTPRDLRLSWSRQEMVSHSILLILKSIETKRFNGGLYSIQTESLHGFQEGSPSEDKMVVIETWDPGDRKIEVWLGSKPGAPKLS